MSVTYWTANQILTQTAGELGLPRPVTVTGLSDVQSVQLLAMLNSAGNELLTYYPWAQLTKEWSFATVDGQSDYDLPDDWAYFTDQTQWDRTNHWPLLGPKSAQEWAWLKGALVAQLPRIRFRVADDQLRLYPTPGSTPSTLAMEYVVKNWAEGASDVVPIPKSMVTLDTDKVLYNPWLMIKFVKLKFYDLKGFNMAGVTAEFLRTYNSLTGKDTGGKILSLSPRRADPYLSLNSVPDGSWNVFGS